MAAKLSFSLTLVIHVLLLLYTGRLRVISSRSDRQTLINQAQEKLDDMTLSMRKSGYGKTARILHANLKRFIHECGFMRSNVTIFAPRDEAMNFYWHYWPPFPRQILTRRVEEEDFWSDHIVKGIHLYPSCELMSPVNVTEHPKYVPELLSISNARVLHWSIYRDDLIVVHGVDSFFGDNLFDDTSYYSGFTEYHYLPAWNIPWGYYPSLGRTFERVF